MKLATFEAPDGRARLGVVKDDAVIDAHALAVEQGADPGPFVSMQSLIDAGPQALEQLRARTARSVSCATALRNVQLLAPLPRPCRLRCFSSYERHLKQAFEQVMSRKLGKAPFSLLRAIGVLKLPQRFYDSPGYYKGNNMAVSGPDSLIAWPSYSEQLDYELELAVVIGQAGRDVPAECAHEHIFGYTIFNDFSARDVLMKEMGMGPSPGPAKGKDFDTGNAFGPWIVTADEMGDPSDAGMSVSVNGEIRGRGKVGEHYHSIASMIAYASRGETLHPGEILACGAVGNGTGLEFWRFLEPGDTVELEIERIGRLRSLIGPRPDPVRPL